ncbi:hypothetical protein CRG98_027712 [Punica granatum]|uniref:Uncharacterized protein n=1 Tax=Punica granatum TaxID=22663 RepID=A0A2I0J6K7_PUNGR|nr:hypothetical protein CRG98_027712 [Punica granatum]
MLADSPFPPNFGPIFLLSHSPLFLADNPKSSLFGPSLKSCDLDWPRFWALDSFFLSGGPYVPQSAQFQKALGLNLIHFHHWAFLPFPGLSASAHYHLGCSATYFLWASRVATARVRALHMCWLARPHLGTVAHLVSPASVLHFLWQRENWCRKNERLSTQTFVDSLSHKAANPSFHVDTR